MRARSVLTILVGLCLGGPASALDNPPQCPPADRGCLMGQLETAAAGGDVVAKIDLARMLLEETDAPGSWQRAAGLLQETAATGDSWSASLLAGLYRDGKGVPADGQKVIALLVPLAMKDNVGALSGLGDLFAKGAGTIAVDLPRAARYYERAGAAGDIHANFQLALMLLDGKGIPADVPKAVALLEKLSEAGDPWILIQLADVYVTGKAAPAERAIDYFRKAVDTGNSAAMVRLAQLYQSGIGTVPPDAEAARKLLEQAAALGQPAGQVMLAQMLLAQNDNEATARAVMLLDTAAGTGDVWATTVLADLLIRGERIPADGARALALLSPLAEQQNAAALGSLGNLYASGAGTIAADPLKAAEYFKAAATLGDYGAKSRLGMMLVNGDSIAPDPAEGLKLLQDVAAIGDGWAKIQLGDVLVGGKALPLNPEGAVAAYQSARDSGLSAGAIKLGNLYLTGAGDLAPDPKRAATYFAEAAESGESVGQINLALLLLDGKGVSQDVDQAVGLLRQAASNGAAWANSTLGALYADGRHVKPDYDEALAFSSAAQKGGDEGAMLRLGLQLAVGPMAPAHRAEGLNLVDKAVAAKVPNAIVERARLQLMGLAGRDGGPRARDALLEQLQQDNPSALRLLLQVYRSGGPGLKPDLAKAQALLDGKADLLAPDALAYETIALRAASPNSDKSLRAIGKAFGDVARTDRSQTVQMVFWANKNGYVYLLQQALRDAGIYRGPVSGLLTKPTITAINRVCRQMASERVCAQGPLTPGVAMVMSDYLATRPDIVRS